MGVAITTQDEDYVQRMAQTGAEDGSHHQARVAPARVLIADHGLIRLGLRFALRNAPEINVCAEADNARGAISEAESHRPDVCLVGWDLPGGAISAVRSIAEGDLSAAVVVIASTRSADDLVAAIRAGATGYVPGNTTAEGLRRVIRAVLAHEAAVPRSMVRYLAVELRRMTSELQQTTGREAEVLTALRRGDSTVEIARRLGISPVTVRRHISDLVRKLGVENRAALVNGLGGQAEARG